MKKRSLFTIAVLIVALLAAGCKKEENATDPVSNNTAQSETEQTEAEQKGGKTITYYSMWNETETQAEANKKAIARYEAATGNKVEVQWYGRDVRKTLKSSIDAGEQVDVVENSPDWLYPNLGTTDLLKLDSYMDKTYGSTDGKAFKDTLLPSMLDFARTYAEDGAYYYVPNQPSISAIFYNKDIFVKAGITMVPTNWDEFLAACEKIKAAGFAPLTVDDAYYSLLYGQYLSQLKGDDWAAQLVTDKTGEMWKDPAVLQMAQAFAELHDKGYFSETTGSNVFPAGQQEVALGTTAMYLNGSWFPNEVATTTGPDFNWGVMAFPNIPNAAESNTKLCLISQGYGICAKSEYPDDAFELITYLMDAQTQQDLADTAACIPETAGATWPKALADAKTLFDNMTGTFTWAGGVDSDADFSAVLKTEFAKLLSGSITAEDFVSSMQEKAVR